MLYHDVLIVGGGLAGLRTAVGLCDKYNVGLFSKVHPIRSHSIAAQGGINAALANNPDARDDTPEKHTFDTVKGGDYLGDQDAVEIMCKEAPIIVYEMEHWGCPFSRFPDNTIAQRPFGGAGYPRTCFSADITGHVLLNTLYERSVYKGVKVYSEYVVLALVTDGDSVSRCNRTGSDKGRDNTGCRKGNGLCHRRIRASLLLFNECSLKYRKRYRHTI